MQESASVVSFVERGCEFYTVTDLRSGVVVCENFPVFRTKIRDTDDIMTALELLGIVPRTNGVLVNYFEGALRVVDGETDEGMYSLELRKYP